MGSRLAEVVVENVDPADPRPPSREMLATLLAIRIFVPEGFSLGRCAVTGSTDNLGNSFVVSRGLSTAYPLSVTMMQIASDLERRGA